ncbi:ATP-binding cassette domain-containing protein [Ochrobactrum teleogrylli]|uniref:ATP-binding cassette domain-containing protein n=1 Tax=Ochrobactrum teleogrylli TaxID=2479765 RepID=UPI00384ED1FE
MANEFAFEGISVRYGAKNAISSIGSAVAFGQALAVAGANGAGKSSLLNTLAGSIAAYEGVVRLQGKPVVNEVRARLRAGIRLVPEQNKIFTVMTVEENLGVAARRKGSVTIEDAYGWFPRLKERRKTLGGNLSGGEQQMLAIGMAILGDPKVLLLDEPTLGLSVPVIEDLARKLDELRSALNLAVVVSESDAKWLPLLTEKALVIDRGRQVIAIPEYSTDTLRLMENYMVGMETI